MRKGAGRGALFFLDQDFASPDLGGDPLVSVAKILLRPVNKLCCGAHYMRKYYALILAAGVVASPTAWADPAGAGPLPAGAPAGNAGLAGMSTGTTITVVGLVAIAGIAIGAAASSGNNATSPSGATTTTTSSTATTS
jgi:hypothetical protein